MGLAIRDCRMADKKQVWDKFNNGRTPICQLSTCLGWNRGAYRDKKLL
jgi:hypothetical protein